MIISVLSNKKLIIEVFDKCINNQHSHTAKLNNVARLSGFQGWGEVAEYIKSREVRSLDRSLTYMANHTGSLHRFGLKPLILRDAFTDFSLSLEPVEFEKLLRLSLLYLHVQFSGLNNIFQKFIQSQNFNFDFVQSSFTSYDMRSMNLDNLICQLNFYLEYCPDICEKFDPEYGQPQSDLMLISAVIQQLDYIYRDAKLYFGVIEKYGNLALEYDKKQLLRIHKNQQFLGCETLYRDEASEIESLALEVSFTGHTSVAKRDLDILDPIFEDYSTTLLVWSRSGELKVYERKSQ